MEKNANYAMVGLVSLGVIALVGVFVIWLAGAQFSQRYDVYDVVFYGPVRGLSVGGSVYFNGIKVGEVEKLKLNLKDPNRVDALVRINSDTPVRTDSSAGLEPQGVTGVNYIQITAGTPAKPLLKEFDTNGMPPEIESKPSTLDSLLQGGGDVLTRTVGALDQVNRLLSAKNLANVTGTLENLRAVTADLKKQDLVLTDLDQSLKTLNQTSARIGELSEDSRHLITGDGQRLVTNLADSAAELKATAAETRSLIAALRQPTNDFAAQGLPEITRAAASLRVTSESLDRLVRAIEANPSAAILKAPAKTVEMKP